MERRKHLPIKIQIFALVSVLVAGLQIYAARDLAQHRYSWDIVPIIGVAFSLDEKPVETTHALTFEAIRSVAPPKIFRELTQGPPNNNYRQIVYVSPEAFAAQLPFYAIKPAYPAMVWLLSRWGINPVHGTALISCTAYAGLVIVLLIWFATFTRPIVAGALTLVLTTNPTLLSLAIFPTPDALSACVVLIATFLMARGRFGVALAVGALAVLIRPDTMLLLLLLATWAFVQGSRFPAVLFAAVGIVVAFVITQWAEGYSWPTFFYHSFIKRLADPASFTPILTFSDYLSVYIHMVKFTISYNHAFLAMLILAVLGMAARYQRKDWHDRYFAILAICSSYMIGLWLVMPGATSRYLAPIYLLILIALIRNLVDAFESRYKSCSET